VVEEDVPVRWQNNAISPYLLQDADELLVALPVNLGKIDVLEVAFLPLLVTCSGTLLRLRLTSHALLRNAHLSTS